MSEWIYGTKVTNKDGQAYGGFQWPSEAPATVTAPDWNERNECGGGLHFWRDGCGDINACSVTFDGSERWYLVRAKPEDVIDLSGKVKAKQVQVVQIGTRHEITTAMYAIKPGAIIFGMATAGDCGTATAGDFGTATAGDRGTATAGYKGTATAGDYGTATAGDKGTATAGDYGTATAGDYGTATAGDKGTATAGDYGTATAGDYGTIIIKYYDGSRYRLKVGYIGEGLEPKKPYRINAKWEFEEVKT
jgi:hypothetical protein